MGGSLGVDKVGHVELNDLHVDPFVIVPPGSPTNSDASVEEYETEKNDNLEAVLSDWENPRPLPQTFDSRAPTPLPGTIFVYHV